MVGCKKHEAPYVAIGNQKHAMMEESSDANACLAFDICPSKGCRMSDDWQLRMVHCFPSPDSVAMIAVGRLHLG